MPNLQSSPCNDPVTVTVYILISLINYLLSIEKEKESVTVTKLLHFEAKTGILLTIFTPIFAPM